MRCRVVRAPVHKPVDGREAALYGAAVLRRRWFLSLLAAFACTSADPQAGRRTPDPSQSHRIVALTPSSTEIVAAVGGLDMLVGVDQFSSYPASVTKLPKVGDFLAPNVEAILALGSDIAVLDATQKSTITKLNQAGITTVVSPMQNLSDVRKAMADVGRAIGKATEAERAIAALDADLAGAERRAQAALARAGRKPKVLVVIDRRPGGFGGLVAAGPGTYLDELVRRAGADNVLSDAPVRYAAISVEEVIARTPDVIIDATHTDEPETLRGDWDALATVPAVKNGRVYVVGDPVFEAPGPRLGAAQKKLVALIWPEER